MNIVDDLLSWLAPHRCVNCLAAGEALCSACEHGEFIPANDVCIRCNSISIGSKVCVRCRIFLNAYSVHSVADYDKAAKKVVWGLKFEGKRVLAELMAKQMKESLPYQSYDVVTHAPSSSNRNRQRGFDHSKLIAKQLAKELGIPYANILARHSKLRQQGSTRRERTKQLKGAFTAKAYPQFNSVLLVDDVSSTGSTLGECLFALKKAGYKKRYGVVYCRN